MADEVVITELTIDARQAEVGSATYVKAMKAAQSAVDRVIDQANAANVAMEKQSTVMTGTAGSISSTAKAWERLKASADPAYRATKDMERAMITADAAARKLGIDETERARVLDLVRQKTDAVSAATRSGTTHIASVGTAARLTSNQMLNLSRQGNDVITMFALGAPPMQIFASQAGQIFDALESGPQGALGSLKAVGAGLLSFVATPLGGIVTAAGLAGVAIGAYALAARQDIKSADEVLKNHKALIDEIAKAYPAAAAAAKKYEDQASQMPKSVIAADTADNVKEARKTFATLMNDMRRQMDLLNTGDGDFARIGKAGIERFAELSKELKSGTLNAVDLQSELGRIRLDPTLSKNAHDFAKGLQDTAAQAAKVAAAIPADLAAKSIAVDNQKAIKSLAEVAAGFKDINSNAGTADSTIAKLFGDMSGGGSGGFGVTRSLGGSIQGVVGQFESAGQAIQNLRRQQVQSMLELTGQFRDTTAEVAELKDAIASAAKDSVKDFFGGDVSNIKNANSELQNSVDTVNSLFDALNTGSKSANVVASGLDLIRQTLIKDGFGVDQVNKFVDSLIKARAQMDAGVGDAAQLNRAIQAIKNRTVTITVVTQQVGTGTKSTYDVGTTGGIGVTRYGGQSDMTQQSYSVPATGGYSSSIGTTGVTVTRFGGTRASGGPVSAHTPYWVGEKGPELVVPQGAGSVIPNAQSMALANPQSAFTGQVATRESDRMWQLFMNIEANTRKTYEGVEKWGASSSYSGGSSSGGGTSGVGSIGSGGGSSGGGSDSQRLAYLKVLGTWRNNYAAAGIVGSGNIGYGSQGLGATPEQIAYNIVYGGMSSVGSAGANRYEKSSSRINFVGFAAGGMIGGDSRDTQKVEFFKRPAERVIIADNDQIDDQRGGKGGGSRTVNVNVNVKVDGGSTMSKESLAALGRQTEQSARAALRSVYGR